MEFTNHLILLSGILLLLSILVGVVSARAGMPLLLVFLIIGMLFGEEGPGGIRFHDVQSAHIIGSLALAVILFDGGLRTDVKNFRVGLAPALVLATLGVLLTAAVTGFVATRVLGLDWLQGMLLGAIVSSTDAAAVFALLHAHGLTLKQRVGSTLEIESGANDPMAVFLTITLVEAIATGQQTLKWPVVADFVLQMGLGAAIGWAGGIALGGLINRLTLNAGLYPLAALGGALLIFGGAGALGASGFLAVYLAGLVLGNRRLQAGHNIRRFHDGMAWLSQIGMFLVLGLLVTPSQLLVQAPQALLIAAVLTLAARPLAVALCLAPFRFPWRDQAFIAWVGLRGAVPIVLALFPLLAGLEHAGMFFNVAFFVVLISLLVQGWTVAPAARRLGLEVPPAAGAIQRVELDIPGQYDYELVGYRLEPDSPVVRYPSARVAMPETVRIAGVIREGRSLSTCDVHSLAAGDYVYLLAAREHLEALDRLFAAVHLPERLEQQRFFGEFVIRGEAPLADLAAVYGFDLPQDAVGKSAAEYLAERFKQRPVVGDRVRLGHVQLVVRELLEGRIASVGLKLGSEA